MATQMRIPRSILFDIEEDALLKAAVDGGFAKSIHAAVKRAVRDGIPAIMGAPTR